MWCSDACKPAKAPRPKIAGICVGCGGKFEGQAGKCDQMTDPLERVPHPKAPTVGHVVPLAKGGTHERANCRTACFRCNCGKQDRGGGEQFALVLEYEGAT